MRIAIENDVFSFAFTSEWINCVSKYIIGIAAAVSGDLFYAERLYKEVEIILDEQKQNFPIYAKIKQRIPLRLAEIYQAHANIHYNRWVKNRNPEDIEKIGFYINQVPAQQTDKYGILLLKTIYNFLNNRDVDECIRILKKCKRIQDSVWIYNIGFLYGYKGDLKKAIQYYNKALYEVEPKVINEVEDFICWLLEIEPDKYQLYYCLAYFNWKIKGDERQAIKDFKTFLAKRKDNEFNKENELALKWIDEIRGKKSN